MTAESSLTLRDATFGQSSCEEGTRTGIRKPSPRDRAEDCRQPAYHRRLGADGHLPGVPAQLDSLIGRSDELVELRQLARTTRLLTLTGPAGVGKTRLALELVRLEQRGRRTEVRLVELGSVSEGEQVRRRITAALVQSDDRGTAVAGTRSVANTDRDWLLVLDNCEHVIDDCGTAVSALLHRYPRLRILATSRESLRLPGEVVYSLSGLGVPDPAENQSLTSMLRSDAVRLFVDRAQAVSEFQLTDDNAAHVGALCAGLDGLPLALQLAAEIVGTFPPAQVHRLLDDRLALLTCARRTAEPRHRSLRSAIGWSYDLLTPEERSLMRSLSLLPGGFGLDAAVVLAEDKGIPASEVPELLVGLETKSLIVACSGRASSARFRMLESIQCYAQERLRAEGEEPQVYDRLVDWFTELACPLRDMALTPAASCLRLQEERDNLQHLVQWLSGGSDPRQLLLVAALALTDIHQGQHTAQHRKTLARALECTASASDDRSTVLATAALLSVAEGDYDEAVGLARQAVKFERRRPRRHEPRLARAVLALSIVRTTRGDQGARTDLEECLEISTGLGDSVTTAFCMSLLAWLSMLDGDGAQAAWLVDEALPALRAGAGPAPLRAALCIAGILALDRHDLAGAEAYFTESLHGMHHSDGAGLALWGLAMTAVRGRRFERGLRLCAAVERPGVFARPAWHPWFQARLEEAMATALNALPKARAAGALAVGREMGPRQIVDYAVKGRLGVPSGVQSTERGTHGMAGSDDPLSPREWEVIALVTMGLTNRQVAARMHLSVRTVEAHIRNIRMALDLRSRTHVAAWGSRRANAIPREAPSLSETA